MKSFIAKMLTLQRKLKFKREEMSTHHKLNFGLELEMGLYLVRYTELNTQLNTFKIMNLNN